MAELSREKLTDIFRAGYCIATVRFAQNTDDSPAGARQRLHYLQLHITNEHCEDCDFANRLKGLEAVVAQRMGPEAYGLFLYGGDITKNPTLATRGRTYEQCLIEVIDGAIVAGIIPERMRDWMTQVSERGAFDADSAK